MKRHRVKPLDNYHGVAECGPYAVVLADNERRKEECRICYPVQESVDVRESIEQWGQS